MTHAGARRGFSLVELTIVAVIVGVLALAAVPRFDVAMETANVDRGAAVLQTIWLAERMHRLEQGSFTRSLDELEKQGFVKASVLSDEDFDYRVATADARGVTIRAERSGSSVWRGTLQLDRDGELDGGVSSGERHVDL